MVRQRRRPLHIRGLIAAACLLLPTLASAETAPAPPTEPFAAPPPAAAEAPPPAKVEAPAPEAAPPATPADPAAVGAAKPAELPANPSPAAVPGAPAKVLDEGGAEGGGESGDDGDDSGDDGDDSGDDGAESESAHAPAVDPAMPGVRYTQDLKDDELERRWRDDPASLGSISLGFTDQGRLINAKPFPEGPHWVVVDPRNTFATTETIEDVKTIIERVVEQYPDSERLRVNHISREPGGWLRPHKSHQAGRDADLAFYYRAGAALKKGKGRETIMDVPRNWALLKAAITLTDVQLILVDRRIQKVLYDYALSQGENKAWLDSIFRAGHQSLVQHARRHRDHFHFRFYNPRAQELGRRLQPMMGKVRPDENMAMHKVRRGDTLGGIARKYRSTVVLIRKANAMKGNALKPGMTVLVPTRGPCVRCPIPPEVIVPPRRLPPVNPVATIDRS